VAGALRQRVEAMRTSFSLVLQLAGIESEESLRRSVREHQERLVKRLDPRPGTVLGNIDRFEEAHRWLLIARRDPRCTRQTRDAYAHAIEALLRDLHGTAVPPLRQWDQGQKRLPDKQRQGIRAEEAAARLERFGLKEGLGPSYSPLTGKEPWSRVSQMIQSGELGAGKYLLLWLLPLVLLDESSAASHAARVQRALRQNPTLFRDLDTLVEFRNDVVHHRASPIYETGAPMPDWIDDRLVRAWASLTHALEG
jgi:hypothetical protein